MRTSQISTNLKLESKEQHKQSPLSEPASLNETQKTRSELVEDKRGKGPVKYQNGEYQRLYRYLDFVKEEKFIDEGADRESNIYNKQSKELEIFFNDYLAHLFSPEEDELTQPYDECGNPIELEETDEHKNPDLKENIISTKKPFEFLDKVVNYVSTLFLNSKESDIDKVISKYNQSQKNNELKKNNSFIPIEIYLENKKAVCRHQAILTAHLLVGLIEYFKNKNPSESKAGVNCVYRYRADLLPKNPLSKVKPIGHAVVIYEAENGCRYLLDSTRPRGLALDITRFTRGLKVALNEAYKPYDGEKFVQKIMNVYHSLGKAQSSPAPRR